MVLVAAVDTKVPAFSVTEGDVLLATIVKHLRELAR